ncbi:MAG: MFS transporter [Clostridia bacterium]|nr:MFS transporter [Clostridia bacterium]
MDNENKQDTAVEAASAAGTGKNGETNIYENFNYVGTKETAAYILNDVSNTFAVGGGERYIWDVVKIDFTVSAVVNLFTSAWDIINDLILATIVDNTRTRLGKFRPYLLGMQIPLTLLGTLYWFLPIFFPNTSGTFIPKLIFYFTFNIIQETASTAIGIAKGGYMSTITPNPNERVRLITLAELLSGYLGEDVPGYIFGILYDLINNDKIKMKLSSLFIGMGLTTSLISSAMTMYFFFKSRERVPQSIEQPNIKEGLKAIFTNYPVFLMCLSDFLGGFSVGSGMNNYFIDVFKYGSLIPLANLPSSFNGSISYAFVAPLRRRFSSKAIWVGTDIFGDIMSLGYFIFGMINRNYTKWLPMTIALGVREFISKFTWGASKVINADLWNEAMDYCEWKNGYRMEATTSVAKGLVLKIQGAFMSSVRSLVLKKIGYVQGLKIGTQSDRTKFWEFALCTAVPTITGALGIIPKFLWPLSKQKRALMYKELAERRNELVTAAAEG